MLLHVWGQLDTKESLSLKQNKTKKQSSELFGAMLYKPASDTKFYYGTPSTANKPVISSKSSLLENLQIGEV